MRRLPIILLLIATTLVTFGRAVFNDFVSWDDPETIAANPRLNPPSARNVLHYWRSPAGGLYVPVTYTWWSALAGISLKPAVFHAGSVALHVIAVLLVFSILCRLGPGEASACIGALLFAVHPVQVETVAWASGTKDVLAGVLALVSIDQYLRFASSSKRLKLRYLIALIAFVLAILAKPSAVIVPLIAGVLSRVRYGTSVARLTRSLMPMLLLAIACAIWTRAVQDQFDVTETPLWTRPLIALDAIAFYLWKLVWPANLAILYGRTPHAVIDSGVIFYTAWVPVALGVLIWLLRRRTPLLAGGAVVFVVGLLPVLGLTRFMFQIHSTVADHYLYLPMLGCALSVAAIVSRRPTLPVYAISATLIAIMSVVSILQIQHWRNDEGLFARAVMVNPTSAVARDGLGKAYAMQNRIDEAIEQFRINLELAPTSRLAHTHLAQAYLLAGQYGAGIEHAQIAVRLAQSSDDTRWELSIIEQAMEAQRRDRQNK